MKFKYVIVMRYSNILDTIYISTVNRKQYYKVYCIYTEYYYNAILFLTLIYGYKAKYFVHLK